MLTSIEIMMIVNDYIGVEGGNLSGFSFKSLEEFYPHYCSLEIDTNEYTGTKKERFINILRQSGQEQQSKILQGLIHYLPLQAPRQNPFFEEEPLPIDPKKNEAYNKIEKLIVRLNSSGSVIQENLTITNETVKRAIEDAKVLIKENGGTSGVDRVHTALQGYLRQVCKDAGISYKKDDVLTQLIGNLRANHPSLQDLGPRSKDIESILNSFRDIFDKLNPIRNRTTLAHPNETLLAEDEALFVIDSAHTILNYLNRKFRQKRN